MSRRASCLPPQKILWHRPALPTYSDKGTFRSVQVTTYMFTHAPPPRSAHRTAVQVLLGTSPPADFHTRDAAPARDLLPAACCLPPSNLKASFL
ncbi:hypothetical protein GWK47_013589 [Chionoecetes opilio]|uniref:Uncharacterized protein n=1 Tax=Chionoecetes opilio TaxID=41210 RepID=A0A8J4Y0K5_CHIOP|nr:hypothetical protein GWK47_013589 [Chionoecetes opilio]